MSSILSYPSILSEIMLDDTRVLGWPGLAWPQQVQHMDRIHSPQGKATQQPFQYVLHWGGDGRSSPRHVSSLQ